MNSPLARTRLPPSPVSPASPPLPALCFTHAGGQDRQLVRREIVMRSAKKRKPRTRTQTRNHRVRRVSNKEQRKISDLVNNFCFPNRH